VTILENGVIVTPEGLLEGRSLVIEGDRIVSLESSPVPGAEGDERIDVAGAFIMPGFIDIHADYIERMAAPRPSSLMDFTLALREAEREFVTHGITTMFHSLSFYKDGDFGHNPIRSSENTARLMELVHRSHSRQHLIRHRFHARFEVDNTDRVEELTRYLREGKIHLLSFMDHTPGQGQFRNLEIYRKTIKGYRSLSEAELDRMIADIQARERLTAEDIAEIAGIATEHGISLASHDDDSPEKLALVTSFGTRISEFPITLEIAREARRLGMHTVAGAPNILLGGSHSGNLSAAEAIIDGSVDVLCSDYYPAALLHAVFTMHRKHGLPLHDMVNLATRNAALAVGMDAELGSVEAGKKADLLVVDELEDGFPVVTAAFVDGRSILRTSYRS
jgi:phosphonate metabolism protein PhnM